MEETPLGHDGQSRHQGPIVSAVLEHQHSYRPGLMQAVVPVGHRSSSLTHHSDRCRQRVRGVQRITDYPPPSRPPAQARGPRRRPSMARHAAVATGGVAVNSTSRAHTTQMMRASLLATAIVALLCPR